MIGKVTEDISTTCLEVLCHARQRKQPTQQLKEVVNQHGDINEWKRKGIFVTIFNTPVLPLDTTKLK